MMKKIIYFLSVLSVFALIVLILVSNKRATERKTRMVADAASAIVVKAVIVKDSIYPAGFSASGVLEASRELKFVSDVTGRVTDIHADEGSYVSRGKVLLQLDDEMLRTELTSSEAAYESLKRDYDRFRSSNEQGGVTDQQLDNTRTQMIAAESRYLLSKRHLADASIKSPIAGTINKRYVEVGSYVNPGSALFDIIDNSKLKAMCHVTEKQILDIGRGKDVMVSCGIFPGESFKGKITFIGEKADRSLNFPVEVTLADHGKTLKPGMYVTLHFNSGAKKEGILIPRNAITGSVQSASVFVVENGVANRRNIIIGNMVGEQVEILQGVHPGDSIVTGGLINVTGGSKVKVIR